MGFEYGEVAKLKQQVLDLRIASGQIHDKVANRVGLLAIRKVKKMTPVGETGDLRNNWRHYVVKKGDTYIIVIHNPIEYASFVEDGHRIVVAGKTVGWVEGRFMMKLTADEMETLAPNMWKRDVEREMRKIFG